MIGATFVSVPVIDDLTGEALPVFESDIVESSMVPVGTFEDAVSLVDAFALDLMFTADENPANLNYRGVILCEVADDGETILNLAGRNLL